MKKWSNNAFWAYVYLALMILSIILCIALIVLWIYALVAYGGKPITEIPFWALWFLGRK